MSTFEHEPWIGDHYRDGLDGKRIAIIGNSHWLKQADGDEPGFTKMVVAGVAAGDTKLRFFSSIPPYFQTEHNRFWSSVLFFNYAPWAIGAGHQRYDKLTSEMAQFAKERLMRILTEHQPGKVFVFSESIRWALPTHHLMDPHLPIKSARIGTLLDSRWSQPLYLLRHTQGAKRRDMTETIASLMSR